MNYIAHVVMADQAKRKGRARRENWSKDEVLALLNIWKDPEIRARVAAPATNKKDLWGQIATLLHDTGAVAWDGTAIHNKIKDLKALHKKLHDQLNMTN